MSEHSPHFIENAARDSHTFYENPALNPTRQYEDNPHIELELNLVIGSIPAPPRQYIRKLLSAGRLPVTDKDHDTVSFINDIAHARGFVPLIETRDGTWSVTSAAKEPLTRALADLAKKGR